ncbi:MAG: hypothetical protein ACTSYX_04940 [Candidatus Thorarchaeota archaeon]
MVSEISVYDLPVHVGVEVEQLVSLIEQERKIQQEVMRQRDIVLQLLMRPEVAAVRKIVTQCHVVSVEKASPHRRLHWARLEKEFPEAYEFLVANEIVKVIPPRREWKLVVREKKRKGDGHE